MPLLIAQADASNHNYSSARFDSQGWGRFVQFVQHFLSGSERSYGILNRLVDIVLAEARFTVPELRNPPKDVAYQWTWAARPHVDQLKEAAASEKNLTTRKSSLTEELAAEGKSIDSHIRVLSREVQKFEKAGLPLPSYMTGSGESDEVDPNDDEPVKKKAKANV